MSLQDPTAKMSKSDPNHAATVFITDRPEDVRKKIMSAVTDSSAEVRSGPDKPGVTNLLSIMSACTGRPVATLEAEFAGKGYGDFKKAVADAEARPSASPEDVFAHTYAVMPPDLEAQLAELKASLPEGRR